MTYDASQITNRIFIGANVTSAQDVADIAALGITHVVDANTDDEIVLFGNDVQPPRRHPPYIALYSAPTEDDGATKAPKWFHGPINFAMGALAHAGYSILFHCSDGINRSPSLAYAVMRAQGWTSADALSLIRSSRPQIAQASYGGVRYWPDAETALKVLGWINVD